jgi:putative ABC transport system substrate-binding protein
VGGWWSPVAISRVAIKRQARRWCSRTGKWFALGRQRDAQIALAQRVPTFGSFRFGFVQAGALFTYNNDAKESYQGVARVLKKILSGATPADIPVEQPTKFTLTINLRTAKALGLAVPPSLLARADEVIE